MQNVITHDGLTIDISKVSSVLDGEGFPVWAGRVTLVFRDTVDNTVTKITANFTGAAFRSTRSVKITRKCGQLRSWTNLENRVMRG